MTRDVSTDPHLLGLVARLTVPADVRLIVRGRRLIVIVAEVEACSLWLSNVVTAEELHSRVKDARERHLLRRAGGAT